MKCMQKIEKHKDHAPMNQPSHRAHTLTHIYASVQTRRNKYNKSLQLCYSRNHFHFETYLLLLIVPNSILCGSSEPRQLLLFICSINKKPNIYLHSLTHIFRAPNNSPTYQLSKRSSWKLRSAVGVSFGREKREIRGRKKSAK